MHAIFDNMKHAAIVWSKRYDTTNDQRKFDKLPLESTQKVQIPATDDHWTAVENTHHHFYRC